MLEYLKTYYTTARNLLKHRNHVAFELCKSECLSENFDSHDNWNGGIDYFTIVLTVPTNKYVEIEDKEKKEIADAISQAFVEASINNESIQVNGVVIVPYDEEGTVYPTSESMWIIDYFRLFISHISKNKTSAANLQKALLDWGIHGFVAHEDIEPSKEWVSELYNALFSMDALCAILVNGFRSSRWCDQEVGIALGQNKLCIPINKEINPYGFLGRYQVLKAHNLDARYVAQRIAEIIFADDRTHGTYCCNIIRLLLNAKNIESALKVIKILTHFSKMEKSYIEMLWKDYSKNTVLLDGDVLAKANKIFTFYGLSQIQPVVESSVTTAQEELPF
ncbi:toll/interleukin-1 receptor domain-containing protein [Bacteroides acidifaciens]|jgi:hypothetical protein|uniref:toll/interleukin-1 receptor domain-containing protein n=1 Tax=Bacteroides acidifaciens TaxID=85831 RepID=UPI0026749A03|nr:toll/interleukin-1 receptor domain-containing protein [Bacteroides acidifaciens]